MLYDSEESKKSEERFAELLANVRSIDKEQLSAAMEKVNNLFPLFQEIAAKQNHTEKDIEFLTKFPVTVQQLLRQVEDMKIILGQSLVRQCNTIYEHIKTKAAEGDEQAIAAFKALQPLYKNALTGQFNSN